MQETWLKALLLSCTASALVARARAHPAVRHRRDVAALMAATLTDPTTDDGKACYGSGAPRRRSARRTTRGSTGWITGIPVAWTRDLPVDAVTKVTLFDVDYCVVNRGEREPLALEDKCPHRLAALSEGRLTAQGYVQCAYHGWSFDTSGDCKSTIRSAASTALCATAVPCRVEQGLLWLFPGAAAGRDPESVAPPPRVPEMDDPAVQVHDDGPRPADRLRAPGREHSRPGPVLFAHQAAPMDIYSASKESPQTVTAKSMQGCSATSAVARMPKLAPNDQERRWPSSPACRGARPFRRALDSA